MSDPNIFITSKGSSIIINNVINLEDHHIIYLSKIKNGSKINKKITTKVFFNQEEIQYKCYWESPLKDITEKIILKYKSIGWENYTITYNVDEYLQYNTCKKTLDAYPRQSVTIDFRK